MSKIDKYIFAICIFLTISYEAWINISGYLYIPSTLISGVNRIIVFVFGGYLFVKDIICGEFKSFSLSFWCYLILISITTITFAIDDLSVYNMQQNLFSYRVYWFYQCFVLNLGTFFTFCCGRKRLLFLMENPIVIYIPSIVSLLIIFAINWQSILSGNINYANNEISMNRANTKDTAIFSFLISCYYVLFSKKLWGRLLLGLPGLIISILLIFSNGARSILISCFAVILLYLAISLKNVFYFIYSILCGSIMALIIMPIISSSNTFRRFAELMHIRENYLEGASEFSRFDLISESFSQFLNSPMIFGTGHLLSGSHLIFTEVLTSSGIVGIACFLIMILASAKSAARGLIRQKELNMPNGYFVLIGIIIVSFSENLFHGMSTVLYGTYFIGLMLSIDIFMRNNRQGVAQ